MIERDTSNLKDDPQLCSYRLKHVLDNSVVHYKHDDYPSDDTSVPLALRWLSISETLHTSVIQKKQEEIAGTDANKPSAA